jgi:hypothetical protein
MKALRTKLNSPVMLFGIAPWVLVIVMYAAAATLHYFGNGAL